MSSAAVDERHGTFLREISTTIGPNDRLYNKTTTKGHDDEDENNKQADYWHFVAFAFLGAPMDVFSAPMASSSFFCKGQKLKEKKQQEAATNRSDSGWLGWNKNASFFMCPSFGCKLLSTLVPRLEM